MAHYIDNMRQVNNTFCKLLNGLTVEQLNKIPAGFSNNIIWNFAHLLAVQQSLFYRLSGLPPTVEEAFIATYKRGTKPEKEVDEREIERIKEMFATAINRLEDDYNAGLFTQFTRYETSMGVVLNNIHEAIVFSTVHDGLHLGYARALKRLV